VFHSVLLYRLSPKKDISRLLLLCLVYQAVFQELFFCYVSQGGGTESTWYAVTVWSFVPTPDDDDRGAIGGMRIDRGNLNHHHHHHHHWRDSPLWALAFPDF
jgi:hypothetical protein